jgi:flagellar export protein FliJ
MPPFRFRAAAALDLRQKQETAAAQALARAETALHEAELRRRHADAERQRAQTAALAAERDGTDGHALAWHRNWIVHLANLIELRTRELEAARDVVRAADAIWREARKRRLSLDRLRERAWHRHQQAEKQEERKAIDELARLRFVAGADTSNGWRDDA